jgi:hypothetical protein
MNQDPSEEDINNEDKRVFMNFVKKQHEANQLSASKVPSELDTNK